jgi:hypothetical protein
VQQKFGLTGSSGCDPGFSDTTKTTVVYTTIGEGVSGIAAGENKKTRFVLFLDYALAVSHCFEVTACWYVYPGRSFSGAKPTNTYPGSPGSGIQGATLERLPLPSTTVIVCFLENIKLK